MTPLPEGWSVAFPAVRNVVVLQYKQHGYVTIDYTRRDFDLGMTLVRGQRPWNDPIPAMYRGRGWRDNLERDAMFALQKIFKDEK
jgi:hypothetical protein